MEKICKTNDTNFEKMNCMVKLNVEGACNDGSEICKKIKILDSESEADTTYESKFSPGKTAKLINFKFDRKKYPSQNPSYSDNGRIIEVFSSKYFVRYLDVDYNNVIDGIEIGKYDSLSVNTGNLPTITLKDSDSDGVFETWGATKCLSRAVYADMLEAKPEGYCIQTRGIVRSSLENVGETGKYVAIGAGAAALIFYTGGLAAPALTAYAGTFAGIFGASLTAESAAELSEYFGGWPNN